MRFLLHQNIVPKIFIVDALLNTEKEVVGIKDT